MTGKIIVYTTCSSLQEAERVARHLIEHQIAACVSFAPGAVSVYRWKGSIETAEEVAVTIKTREDRLEELMTELRKVHSYEVPEILAVPVVAGSPAYLGWVDESLGQSV